MSATSSAADRRRRRINLALWTTFGVAILIIFLILVKVTRNPSSDTAGGASPAPQSLITKLTSLTDKVFSAVGQGSIKTLPSTITASALTASGKPRVMYVGSEYCPYCATERWPMVIALMRFGTFSDLKLTHSATGDVFPDTQTFSFHGASYTSPYISFDGHELQSNVPSGTSYATLDTLSAADQQIFSTFNAAPYVSASSAGSIPFINFGGRFISSGSSYDPAVLQGKSADQIADTLKDTSSDISKGAIGTANVMTAAICMLTGDQPTNVCSSSFIQTLENALKAQKSAN